jgi:hypothetical protein
MAISMKYLNAFQLLHYTRTLNGLSDRFTLVRYYMYHVP